MDKINSLEPHYEQLDADAIRERRKDDAPGATSTAASSVEGEGGETPTGDTRACFTLGPFKPGDAKRDSVRTWLRGRVSTRETEGGRLPPLPSGATSKMKSLPSFSSGSELLSTPRSTM